MHTSIYWNFLYGTNGGRYYICITFRLVLLNPPIFLNGIAWRMRKPFLTNTVEFEIQKKIYSKERL